MRGSIRHERRRRNDFVDLADQIFRFRALAQIGLPFRIGGKLCPALLAVSFIPVASDVNEGVHVTGFSQRKHHRCAQNTQLRRIAHSCACIEGEVFFDRAGATGIGAMVVDHGSFLLIEMGLPKAC
jgi:hypothetical protein